MKLAVVPTTPTAPKPSMQPTKQQETKKTLEDVAGRDHGPEQVHGQHHNQKIKELGERVTALEALNNR